MKIQVSGFAGAGKSTLTKKLASYYNIPALHIDALHFEPNWVVRDNKLMEEDISKFLNENDNWVIDGNYYRHCPERFDQADLIIYLNFNPLVCLFNSLRRVKQNKNIQRPDMAVGCKDKVSLSFSLWLLFGSRKKKIVDRFYNIIKDYPEKLKIFNNNKDLNKFLEEIKNESKR